MIHIKKSLPLLQAINNLSEKGQKVMINEAKRDLILAIVEICKGILSGAFNLTTSEIFKLRQYQSRIKKLADRKTLTKDLSTEKSFINYRGNVGFLSTVISIAHKHIGEDENQTASNENASLGDRNALNSRINHIQLELDAIRKTIIENKSGMSCEFKSKTEVNESDFSN
jgi:hypothetical protein